VISPRTPLGPLRGLTAFTSGAVGQVPFTQPTREGETDCLMNIDRQAGQTVCFVETAAFDGTSDSAVRSDHLRKTRGCVTARASTLDAEVPPKELTSSATGRATPQHDGCAIHVDVQEPREGHERKEGEGRTSVHHLLHRRDPRDAGCRSFDRVRGCPPAREARWWEARSPHRLATCAGVVAARRRGGAMSLEQDLRAIVRDELNAVLRERLGELLEHVAQAGRSGSVEYVTLKTAAKMASVGYTTIRKLVHAGKLPVVREGRIIRVRVRDLDAALRGGEHRERRGERSADEQAVMILDRARSAAQRR
jgi:excisionase family DNA binding protein